MDANKSIELLNRAVGDNCRPTEYSALPPDDQPRRWLPVEADGHRRWASRTWPAHPEGDVRDRAWPALTITEPAEI